MGAARLLPRLRRVVGSIVLTAITSRVKAFAGVTGGRCERHAGLVSSLRGYRR
jgi:hypothetical protein